MVDNLDSQPAQATAAAQREGPVESPSAQYQLVSKLRSTLPRILEHQPVELAYLYGSATTGQVTPFSDIDIAVVVDEDLTPRERLSLVLRLQLELVDRCNIPNADVRIINDAPLVFQGRVVCDGILVYARDEQKRIAFEVDARMRYFDYLPIHRQLQDAFFVDLRERGLYG